jgi:hypothetical protein
MRQTSIRGQTTEAGGETIQGVVDCLTEARKAGRPIIMLLGAGISVDAGIPLGTQLSQYLLRVASLIEKERHPGNDDPPPIGSFRTALLESAWPSRHELAVDLMVAHGDATKPYTLKEGDRRAQRSIGRRMVVAEFRRQHPSAAAAFEMQFKQPGQLSLQHDGEFGTKVHGGTGYRSLLSYLTDNDQSLIDACLDRFVRDREPTTLHQLLVFLANDLGTKVFLTTNFDALLEKALAVEHRAVTAYPIIGPDTIPAARLVAAQSCAVLKLHGSTYEMRVDFDLDEPMSRATLGAFMDIFREVGGRQWPLLLVLGYSGQDGRVMSLVAEHIEHARRLKCGPAVVWVSHVDNEKDLPIDKRDGRVHFLHYPDGRLFLQDAYLRRRGEFPVARSHYQAVAFVARTPVSISWDAIQVITSDNSGAEASDAFARRFFGDATQPVHRRGRRIRETLGLTMAPVFAAPAEKPLIFFHGAPQAGTSCLLSRLAREAENRGRKILWIDLAEIRTVSTLAEILSELLTKADARLTPLWRPLLLDVSLRTTAREGVWAESARRSTARDLDVLVRWLQNGLRRGHYLLILDSLEQFARVHPALRGESESTDWEAEERGRLLTVLHRLVANPLSLGQSQIWIGASSGELDRQLDGLRMQAYDVEVRKTEGPAPQLQPWCAAHADTLSEHFVKGILSASRRPVPVPALVWVAKHLLTGNGAPGHRFVDDSGKVPRITVDEHTIANAVTRLVEMRKVSPAPGGGYWIHSSSRDEWYRTLQSEDAAVLHDGLAHYYWKEVYLRSRDVRAFLEYLFHRMAHLKRAQRCELPSLEKLCSSLYNEIETLLARGRIPSLLFLLRQLWEALAQKQQEGNWYDLGQPVTEPTSRLHDCLDVILSVESELVMASGHPHSALDFQILRLRLRLLGNDRLPLQPSGRDINTIEDLLDRIGELQQGSGLSDQKQVDLKDLRAGLAYTLHGAFEQSGGNARFDDWASRVGLDRRSHMILAGKQYVEAASNAPLPHDRKRARVNEMLMRAARRQAELRLAQCTPNRFMPQVTTEASHQVKDIVGVLDKALEQCRSIGLSRRLHRHRCYLTTLKAMAWHTAYRADGAALEPDAQVLSLLHEAESQLVREAGAAERQALAVLRLTSAMVHIEHAERLGLPDGSPVDVTERDSARLRSLSTAAAHLAETGLLMGTARGELRWRQLFTLYSARYWLLVAQVTPTGRKQHLYRAARFLTAGLTNCGLMTDRRVILTAWWNELRTQWAQLAEKGKENAHDAALFRRLGIDWAPITVDGRVKARPLGHADRAASVLPHGEPLRP